MTEDSSVRLGQAPTKVQSAREQEAGRSETITIKYSFFAFKNQLPALFSSNVF
jgi:hypothetical protein